MTAPRLAAVSPLCARDGCSQPASDGDRCTRHATLRQVVDRIEAAAARADVAAWDALDHTEDRAALLGLARAWDDTVRSLVDNGGLDRGVATTTLLRAAAGHCHPAARPAVVFLMPRLVDAVDQVSRLQSGLLDPLDVVGSMHVWGEVSRYGLAEDALNQQVHDAVGTMLTGQPAPAVVTW